MDVLVEFVRIGDTGGEQALSGRDEDVQRDGVDLLDDVVRNTIALRVPASWEFGRRRRRSKRRALGMRRVAFFLSRTWYSPDSNSKTSTLSPCSRLNSSAVSLDASKGSKILLDLDLLEKLLLVGIVAIE